MLVNWDLGLALKNTLELRLLFQNWLGFWDLPELANIRQSCIMPLSVDSLKDGWMTSHLWWSFTVFRGTTFNPQLWPYNTCVYYIL